MVGLVIVSHSAQLAEGVAELARGMAGPAVPLAATGGLALPDHPLGTDASLVLEAIEQVYSQDGVLVLMDLGSAILSAEMALDQLSPERRARVLLCEAPLVEGALAAAVQIRLGATLEQTAAEARGALAAKATHLEQVIEIDLPAQPLEAAEQSVRLTVSNKLGLHARPAARLVMTASRFPQSEVRVQNLTTGRGPVSAKSINAVTTLGVQHNHEIQISAAGPEANAALAAVQALAAGNFGDPNGEEPRLVESAAASNPSEKSARELRGLPVSSGIAIGVARSLHSDSADLAIPVYLIKDPDAEWRSFLEALDKTRTQIQATREAVARRTNAEAAAIFDAHLLFLEDEALCEPVRQAIFNQKQNGAVVWQETVTKVANQYRTLDDKYFQARANDVEEVGRQVLLNLLKRGPAPMPKLTQPSILVADDLTAAETAGLDASLVLGICTAYGSAMSHSAILARTFGIPAVTGLKERIRLITEGTPLIVDGNTGQVWRRPEQALIEEYTRRAEAARAEQAQATAMSAQLARTHDGQRVEVVANIGSQADAIAAVASGAEGVGLLRTEFLYLNRQTAPDEEEQVTTYRAIAQVLAGRPLIIRTLDIGGDKPVPYLRLDPEANPFLGWRAIRLCLAQPELFKTQLRAILRTAAEFPVKVMFPMIATLSEWRAAKTLLTEARAEVAQMGQAVPDTLETGIMIEIPSAALLATHFALEVDFFSIGTNDLTQYTLAAERGNANVAALADALHPAVLKLIAHTVEAAHAHKKWVGVCGELAGDPVAVPLLVGLGIDELSMNAPAIPRAKQIIRSLDSGSLRSQAQAVLALETAEAVRAAFASNHS